MILREHSYLQSKAQTLKIPTSIAILARLVINPATSMVLILRDYSIIVARFTVFLSIDIQAKGRIL